MDWLPMLKVLFGVMSGNEESTDPNASGAKDLKLVTHYECVHKDSGMFKNVDPTEISLRCEPGTEKAVREK